MSLAEFKEIWNKYNVYNDYFVERDSNIFFNQSMQTSVDELHSDKHIHMTLIEFLEAFARVAEKASLVPQGELVQEWTDQDRIM